MKTDKPTAPFLRVASAIVGVLICSANAGVYCSQPAAVRAATVPSAVSATAPGAVNIVDGPLVKMSFVPETRGSLLVSRVSSAEAAGRPTKSANAVRTHEMSARLPMLRMTFPFSDAAEVFEVGGLAYSRGAAFAREPAGKFR